MVMCCVILQEGDTPLHYASDHIAAIEVLLIIKDGAAINQTNNVSWHILSFTLSTHAYYYTSDGDHQAECHFCISYLLLFRVASSLFVLWLQYSLCKGAYL